MTPATAEPSSTNQPRFTQNEVKGATEKPTKARCRHLTADGTRCRLPILDARSHLCFRHSALAAAPQPHNDAEDLSADLLPELSEFSSGTDILKFLARLLVLVTKGRVSPRRASVLAYITNQLLHSHRAIILETKPEEEKLQQIIIDIPRPDRSEPRHANPTYPDLRT
jgi:hypothetical protein